MEMQTMKVLDSAGIHRNAVLRLWDESPFDEDSVQLELALDGETFTATSERGYFHALCGIRSELEAIGVMPLCVGACENVYPSPMIESMGCGEKAYQLTLGCQAKSADLVSIFDPLIDANPVSVHQQQSFYERWIKSL